MDTKQQPKFRMKPLTPQEQHFYDTMATHYEERSADKPGSQMLADRAIKMKDIARTGAIRIEELPDPNDQSGVLCD